MYGDVIENCRATFCEHGYVRERRSVTVEHLGRNRIEIRFQQGKPPIRRMLGGRWLTLMAPGGRDLAKEWLEGEPRRPSVAPLPWEKARAYGRRMARLGLGEDERVAAHRRRLFEAELQAATVEGEG